VVTFGELRAITNNSGPEEVKPADRRMQRVPTGKFLDRRRGRMPGTVPPEHTTTSTDRARWMT
jgi:hypothetical protein